MSQRDVHKVVVRRLPSSLPQDAFEDAISPYREHISWMRYAPGKKGKLASKSDRFSCAHLNFTSEAALATFIQEFHGYAFIDTDDRIDYAFVQRSLFQRIPRESKVDAKENTIAEDTRWKQFLVQLDAQKDADAAASTLEAKMDRLHITDRKETEKNAGLTPLLKFLRDRAQSKANKREHSAAPHERQNRHNNQNQQQQHTQKQNADSHHSKPKGMDAAGGQSPRALKVEKSKGKRQPIAPSRADSSGQELQIPMQQTQKGGDGTQKDRDAARGRKSGSLRQKGKGTQDHPPLSATPGGQMSAVGPVSSQARFKSDETRERGDNPMKVPTPPSSVSVPDSNVSPRKKHRNRRSNMDSR